MNVVGYGGGTDSTAMLVGLWRHHVPVDLILFADPGAEQPHTYAYLDTMSRWLENHGMPAITRVWYTEKNGQRLTLEQECLRSGTLPSIAYGYKKCSLKHKVAPQEKFCRHYQPCIDAWEKGEKVVKFIGYDAGEERRLLNALPHDLRIKIPEGISPDGVGLEPKGLHPGDPGCRPSPAGQVFLLLLPQHEAVGNSDIVPPLPGFAAAGFGD
mgnify:CR=1 FL=1